MVDSYCEREIVFLLFRQVDEEEVNFCISLACISSSCWNLRITDLPSHLSYLSSCLGAHQVFISIYVNKNKTLTILLLEYTEKLHELFVRLFLYSSVSISYMKSSSNKADILLAIFNPKGALFGFL